MKNKLAVFDIDGTIFRSSLIIELVNGLIKKEIFPKSVTKELEKDYSAWLHRKGSYYNYIVKVVDVYFENIKGKKEKEVRAAIQQIINSEKNKLYVFTRGLIKELKRKNYFLLAISGSPECMVGEFSKSLGFDAFYGSIDEIKNCIFTGNELVDVSKSKPEILLNFIKDNKDFNLKDAVGVGDSEIDITFLELVGNPIAFNPDLKLATYAKEKKWRIVVERKNVVYGIKDFDFEITS